MPFASVLFVLNIYSVEPIPSEKWCLSSKRLSFNVNIYEEDSKSI